MKRAGDGLASPLLPSGQAIVATIAAAGLGACITLAPGCSGYQAGQDELFAIQSGEVEGEGGMEQLVVGLDDIRSSPRDIKGSPRLGDPVRSNEDSLAVFVEGVYLNQVPLTLTGSRDVVVFAEIWENGALGGDAGAGPRLVSIIKTVENQLIPGKLNFVDRIAYGPTFFKGFPLQIKFTVLVLQKKSGQRSGTAVEIIGNFASTAAPMYGPLISPFTALLRDVLRSQPDVVAFEFDATLLSDRPEGKRTLLLEVAAQARKPGADVEALAGTVNAIAADAGLNEYSVAAQDVTKPASVATQALRLEQSIAHTDSAAATRESRPRAGSASLRYGKYAIVETASRQRQEDALFETEGNPKIFDKLDLPKIQYKRGWLWLTPVGATEPEPLPTNYLVFRVDPSQIPIDDSALVAVSAAQQATLTELRQPSVNAGEIAASLRSGAEQVRSILWDNRLRELARTAQRANPLPTAGPTFQIALDKLVAAERGTVPVDIQSQFDAKAKVVGDEFRVQFYDN